MKKETLLKIADAIIAIANELETECCITKLVAAKDEAASPCSPEPAAPAPAEAPRRGRPRKETVPAETVVPTEPSAPAAPAPETPAPVAAASAGPTDEERYLKNRALIEPLVTAARGAEVKEVIAKFSNAGLKGLPAEHQAAFEAEIEALTM